LITLTGRPHSRLARAATVSLQVSVKREACRYNLTPTTSTTAMLAVGDALAGRPMQGWWAEATSTLPRAAMALSDRLCIGLSGIDLDVRAKVARELGWNPVEELLEEIWGVDEELEVVARAVEAVAARVDVPLSVTTSGSAVARAAFGAGARQALEISGLWKSFGDLRVLRGIDMTVFHDKLFKALRPGGIYLIVEKPGVLILDGLHLAQIEQAGAPDLQSDPPRHGPDPPGCPPASGSASTRRSSGELSWARRRWVRCRAFSRRPAGG